MDDSVFDMGSERWLRASGFYDLPRNDKGHIVLQPTARNVDNRLTVLNTDMSKLEDTMRRYREERSMLERQKKTDSYKESKKKAKSKKSEKARQSFLDQVFNAVPEDNPGDEDEDEEGYSDLRGKKRGRKSSKETTLESRYGKRYAAVVSMLQDTIEDFDRISSNIEEELNEKAKARNMYRSTQLGNLLSAKNARLSAIKEMARIADKVTDIEYKKSKDNKANSDETDMSKAIASLGRDVLRGNIVLGGKKGNKKKKSKDKDKKGRSMFERSSWNRGSIDDDDGDDEYGSVERTKKGDRGVADDPKDIDDALARELRSRRDTMYFSPYERNLDVEGKYAIAVTCSAMDTKNWSYIALDPKTGEALKGELRDRVKDLIPKRKAARMVIDLSKMKAKDLNTGKTYKLLLTD